MAELQTQYTEKLKQKEELKEKAEHTEKMLDRAFKLVTGLAGERIRWEQTVQDLEEKMGYLVGDVLVASAFLSYCGPFLSNYRDDLVEKLWIREVRTQSTKTIQKLKTSPMFMVSISLSIFR